MKEITKAFLFSVLLCAALACSMLAEPTDHGTVEPLETRITATEENPIIIGNCSLKMLVIKADGTASYGVSIDE